jgi:hypothetical protein
MESQKPLTIGTIQKAVDAAIRHFGLGRLCRLDAIFSDTAGCYCVRLRDTRKSQFFGPMFSFTIDVAEHSTPDRVRDFTRSQIAEQFAKPSR